MIFIAVNTKYPLVTAGVDNSPPHLFLNFWLCWWRWLIFLIFSCLKMCHRFRTLPVRFLNCNCVVYILHLLFWWKLGWWWCCSYHLQALRHLAVLAAEPRLLVPVDVDSLKPCYSLLEVTYKVCSHHGCRVPKLKFKTIIFGRYAHSIRRVEWRSSMG